jgi:hypothetical protein
MVQDSERLTGNHSVGKPPLLQFLITVIIFCKGRFKELSRRRMRNGLCYRFDVDAYCYRLWDLLAWHEDLSEIDEMFNTSREDRRRDKEIAPTLLLNRH